MKILILFALFITSAQAHFRIKEDVVVPRKNGAGVIPDGIKSGPCGGLAKGTPQVFQAGQEITVKWEETINHPGRYRILWSNDNDQTFTLMHEIVDTQDGIVNRNNPATYHQYEMTVKLPEYNCDNCTLQMIQVMEENPNNPRPYFSCADIRLINGTGGTPTPTPTPNPDPDCD